LLAASVDGRTRELTINTLQLAAGVCRISLPLGLFAAALLARTDLPGRWWFAAALGAMLLTPLYLQVAGWDAGFGRQGWHSQIFGSFAKPWLTTLRGAIWVHAMAATPWAALFIALGLRRVDRQLEEDALLCAGPIRVMFAVTLRRALPAVGAAALWCLVTCATEIAVTDLYRTPTYAQSIYLRLSGGSGASESALRAAPGAALIAALAIAAMAVPSLLSPGDIEGRRSPPLLWKLGRWKPLAVVSMLLLVCLVACAPLANMAFKAGAITEQVSGELHRTWSPVQCVSKVFLAPYTFRREWFDTLQIGAGAATLVLLIAAPLAWWGRNGGVRAAPGMVLSVIGLAVPGPLISVAVIWLLNRDGSLFIWLYDRTLAGPIIACAWRSFPFAFLIAWQGFRTVLAETVEAAATEGAGAVARFWSIGARQQFPTLAAAWLVACIVSMGDLSASILVIPPGSDPLSRRILGLLHAGVDDQVAAISLASWLIFALLAAIVFFLVGVKRESQA